VGAPPGESKDSSCARVYHDYPVAPGSLFFGFLFFYFFLLFLLLLPLLLLLLLFFFLLFFLLLVLALALVDS
jgi:hypothetical protein